MILPGNKHFHYEYQTGSRHLWWNVGGVVLALALLIVLPWLLALPLLLLLLVMATLASRRAARLPLYYQCTLSDNEFYQWHPYRRALRVRVPLHDLRRLYSVYDNHQRLEQLICVTARGKTIRIPAVAPFPLDDFLQALRQLNPEVRLDAHLK